MACAMKGGGPHVPLRGLKNDNSDCFIKVRFNCKQKKWGNGWKLVPLWEGWSDA